MKIQFKQWMKCLDTELHVPSNRNSKIVPKVDKPTNKKTLYKTLGNQYNKQPNVPFLPELYCKLRHNFPTNYFLAILFKKIVILFYFLYCDIKILNFTPQRDFSCFLNMYYDNLNIQVNYLNKSNVNYDNIRFDCVKKIDSLFVI